MHNPFRRRPKNPAPELARYSLLRAKRRRLARILANDPEVGDAWFSHLATHPDDRLAKPE